LNYLSVHGNGSDAVDTAVPAYIAATIAFPGAATTRASKIYDKPCPSGFRERSAVDSHSDDWFVKSSRELLDTSDTLGSLNGAVRVRPARGRETLMAGGA